MPILIKGSGGTRELKTALLSPVTAQTERQTFSIGTMFDGKEIARVRLFLYSVPTIEATNNRIGGAHGASLENLLGSLYGNFPYEGENHCKISTVFYEDTGYYDITPGGDNKFILYAKYALEVLYYD